MRVELLNRTKDIALLLFRHRKDLAENADLQRELGGPTLPEEEASAEHLADDLEKMGPTFVKLGQLLASRSDLLPPAHLKALERLQDQVGPVPLEEIEKVLVEELGVRLSKLFPTFDEEPLAAASLGQVHRAILRDGREVAVKIQRPGIRKVLALDLEALDEIATTLERFSAEARAYGIVDLVAEFRGTLLGELDYRAEAANLETLARNLKEFERILVPRPVKGLCTSRVLVMEYLPGVKIAKISPLRRLELDSESLADELFRAYLHQVLLDGFFHSDPHPGNVLLSQDDHIVLLDVGQVGRLSRELKEPMLQMILAASSGDGDQVAHLALSMSRQGEEYDPEGFRRRVREIVLETYQADLDELRVGALMLEVTREAAEHGVRVPPELSVLGKTLLQLDEIGRTLAPDFNPRLAIQRHSPGLITKSLRDDLRPDQLAVHLLEVKELVSSIPKRLRSVLDVFSGERRLEVKLDVLDENELLVGFQKIANRITAGLVLAALIVGAALIMRIETDTQLFGYPALALLFFVAAAMGGAWLLWSIFWTDRKAKTPGHGRT